MCLFFFFFFCLLPKSGYETHRKRCQRSEKVIKFHLCLNTQLLLTSMRFKWTVIPVHVHKLAQAAANHCHGSSPLRYYDCGMIVIFLSAKKSPEEGI